MLVRVAYQPPTRALTAVSPGDFGPAIVARYASIKLRVTRDLFVYVDESGDFNFSSAGTAWYYLTAVSTFDPSYALAEWHAIKLAAITKGILLEELKASEDKQWIRDRVFGLLGAAAGRLRVDGIAVEKAKTHPSLRPSDEFYGRMMELLLRYVARGRRPSFDRLFVFVDTIPVAKKRKDGEMVSSGRAIADRFVM